MRIAALGVSIDSSGAKKGASEVRQELQSTVGSAERFTASMKRATDELTTNGRAANLSAKEAAKYAAELRALERNGTNLSVAEARWLAQHNANTRGMQQQGAALGQLTNRDIAQAVQRYDAMTQAQQRLQEASGRTQAQMQALGRAHAQALAMDARLSQSFIATAAGSSRLRQSLASLASQATGMLPGLGSLTGVLSTMAVGGVVTAGVLGGAAAIGYAWKSMTEEARKAKEENDKLVESLRQRAERERLGEIGELQKQIDATTKSIEEQREAIERLNAANRQAGLLTSGASGVTGRTAPTADEAARVAEKKRIMEQDAANVRDYTERVKRLQEERVIDELDAERRLIESAIRSGQATQAERARALELQKEYQAQIEKYLVPPEGADEKWAQFFRDMRIRALDGMRAVRDATSGTPSSADRRFDRGEEEIARMREQVARQRELNEVHGQSARVVAELTARLDLKAKLAEIDARSTGANATLTRRQAAELKLLAEALHEAEQKQRAMSAATEERARHEAFLNGVLSRKTQQTKAEEDVRATVDRIKQENAAIDAQNKALARSKQAYEAVVEQQRQEEVVQGILLKAKANNIVIDEKELRVLVAKNAAAKDLQQVLLLAYGLKPPQSFDKVGDMADATARALSAAQGLAIAFGDVGREIGAAVGQAAQLLTNLSRAQRAGIFKDKDGKEQNVGLGGALSGKAGLEGFGAAAASMLGMAGAAVAIADAMDLFGRRAKEARKAQEEWNKALADYAIVSRTSLEQALRDNEQRAQALALQLEAAYDGKPSKKYFESLVRLHQQMEANAAQIIHRATIELAFANQDLEVRRLVAQGRNEEAEALREQIAQWRELDAAAQRFGADSEYVKALQEVQEAEREAAKAARELAEQERQLAEKRQHMEFAANLQLRRQQLSGDDRGALQTRMQIGAASELADAQKLLDAGIITQEMFDELARILDEETNRALADFDEALRKQAQAIRDDIAVRTLLAQGHTKEAETLRRQIRNREELDAITDPLLKLEMAYVHALEEEAIAKEEAREAAERVARQEYDILRRTIDAYRVLDPAKADELERTRIEIDRAKELAEAENEMIRQRLIELHLLEDQAEAARKLAEEQEQLIRAAERLADLTADVEEEWLRATGRDFDADVRALERWRDKRIEEAKEAGASQDVIDMIMATFDAKYKALIESTMQVAEAVVEEAKREANRFLTGRVTASNIAAVSEVTMQTAASTWAQWTNYFAVLPLIERNTALLASGGVVSAGASQGALIQVNQNFYGDVDGFNAEELAAIMGNADSALVKAIDKALGERTQLKDRLAGLPMK